MFNKKKIFHVLGLLMALVLVTAPLTIGCTPAEPAGNGNGDENENGDELVGGEITLATTTSTYDLSLIHISQRFSHRIKLLHRACGGGERAVGFHFAP